MLLSRLPQPTREYAAPPPKAASAALPASITKEPPPYGTAERRQYAPRKQEDFGDGGARGWRVQRSGLLVVFVQAGLPARTATCSALSKGFLLRPGVLQSPSQTG